MLVCIRFPQVIALHVGVLVMDHLMYTVCRNQEVLCHSSHIKGMRIEYDSEEG